MEFELQLQFLLQNHHSIQRVVLKLLFLSCYASLHQIMVKPQTVARSVKRVLAIAD